ncbi:hypothetical protein L0Y40_02040 [Candidatus Wolfebacteria bacterium]|nr:hypothetical protein [Candidatus Wolfebacteria bacterium]
MSWAGRRRALYVSIISVVVFAFFIWVGFRIFYTPPTCFDGKRNGVEEGIDCGGECERVCSFQATPPIVLWSRFFQIAPGVYNIVALIENPNVGVEARDVPYVFKLYDANGLLVYERKGQITIPAEHSFVVFESDIIVGERIPQNSFFEFTEVPDWQRREREAPTLRTGELVLSNVSTAPRLTAMLENTMFADVENIAVVAVVFDENGNALATSRTIVDRLGGGERTALIFTWQTPFPVPAAKTVLYPEVRENER